jgi:hypothetical protein
MAVVTTSVTAAADGTWTAVYTAAAGVTLYLQNRSSSLGLLVRVDASGATSDALTAAAENLNPGESRAFPIVSGDKVWARPNCNVGDVIAQSVTVIKRV